MIKLILKVVSAIVLGLFLAVNIILVLAKYTNWLMHKFNL